ncbi:MAG TPA: nitrilase-related carbon-nitrogen hydrolase, partial [bacterium]|nr:nitrilase-related carbon-nitrogen hydrolase [bacterium]
LGAKFLVTITNDAWFGKTSAPYQHWDQVAMRAIENRRYVARAANTGISGIIDPLGRTIKATDIYVPATYVGTVKTLDIRTVYATIGDVAAYAAAVIYAGILLILAIGNVRRRKEKAK